MKVKICGARGSIPVTGSDRSKYGGNTSCIEVFENGWLLVLDGGSGIQNLSHLPLLKHNRIDILLSHFHLDHIQGLGFFGPLFDSDMEVHIWGPSGSMSTLQVQLSRYLSPPLFPISLKELPCKLVLHDLENSSFEIGPFKLESRYVIHPGPTVGYRISLNKSVFAYIPDHEPALGFNGMIQDTKWISGIDISQNADILIHDAQYTNAEYLSKKGWGHSSINDAALFASLSNVKHVLFSHHNPKRTDDQLDNILHELQNNHQFKFNYELAKEGSEYELN